MTRKVSNSQAQHKSLVDSQLGWSSYLCIDVSTNPWLWQDFGPQAGEWLGSLESPCGSSFFFNKFFFFDSQIIGKVLGLHVWKTILNTHFQFLNNIIRIFIYFFTHTYFKKLQPTLLKLFYQTELTALASSRPNEIHNLFNWFKRGLSLFLSPQAS